ncbi:interleukin-15 receptor subunit alpha [Phoenicopterus ruber ruber]
MQPGLLARDGHCRGMKYGHRRGMKFCKKASVTGGVATSERKHAGNGAFPFSIPRAQAQPSHQRLFAVRCSRPKAVANAHIDAGNNTLLNTRLRYTCNPGFKRKAGTSSLIQCILRDGSTEPDWTYTTLQCIRDPALPPLTPSPELPPPPHTKRTIQRGTTDASPDGPSPETSTLPEMPPPLATSTLGEGTALGTSLGTTPLPTAPTEHAAVSIQTVASSIGVLVLVVVGVVACRCWRMKMRMGRDYVVEVTAIPMMAPAAQNEEMLPPAIFPTG